MKNNDLGRHLIAFAGAAAVLATTMLSPATAGAATGVAPEAEQLLRAATSFLASQERFSVDTHSTLEAVLESGQKIQFDHAASLSVQRPDKLRAERRGDLVDQVFYYDGKSLTLQNPDDGYYATVAAPDTLEAMLDFATDVLDIVAPAGDLIYSNAYEILMQDVTFGYVVGKSVVQGVRCDHLAFRAPHVDWQIWIQEGDQPLPRKFVITSTDVMSAPQFAVVMSKWNLQPAFGDEVFAFTPPSAARQIEFLSRQAGDMPTK